MQVLSLADFSGGKTLVDRSVAVLAMCREPADARFGKRLNELGIGGEGF